FRGRNAELLKKTFFAEAVLGGFERLRRRVHRNLFGQVMCGLDRNVFEFIGDQGEAVCEFFECFEVGIFGGNARRDAADRRLRRRIKETEMKIERVTGQSEHVAELAAAKNADGHLRFLFLRAGGLWPAADHLAGSGEARTFFVCVVRNLRKASRIAGYLLPSEAAASNAALIAPALPMASVPTGIPPGIWAIASSESKPLSALDSIGTPNTGSTVFDAVIPGRCAAPPAPAMMTSMPRLSASAA